MPDYYNRTLQSDSKHLWDPTNFIPDIVLTSLGGNDYNHQEGREPTQEDFNDAYEKFWLQIFGQY